MSEIVQNVSPIGASTQTTGAPRNAAANRPIISQTFAPGGSRSAATDGGSPTIEQTVSNKGASGPMLSSTTREMLDNLDKYGSVRAPAKPDGDTKPDDPPPAAAAAASAVAPSSGATQAPPAAAAATAVPAAADAPKLDEPAAADEHRAAYERVSTRNRELLAENEKLKAGPRREPTPREKALDEAERMYLDDPVGAIRRFIATVQGADDPKHKDVDAELSGLYQDLTARELGVPVDPTRQELRESTRTRLALARDKREWRSEREAAAATPPEDPEAKLAAEHTSLIGSRLSSKSADGKAIADAYPLTMKLAEKFHGSKPEALILATIRAGFKTGEFDPEAHDDVLIEQAAKKIEAHYQDLADTFGVARPQPSTAAAPTTTADATANKDAGQKQGTRTITNASASVAPATPPAKQSEKPDEDKPKYKSEHERRLAIARKYIRD